MAIGPIQEELVEVGDYFRIATNPRPLVAGRPGNRTLGLGGEWTAKVVGTDPETGAQVTIAWYDHRYGLKADATKRSKELLSLIKQRVGATT